jgi:hypothetical protein
LHVIVGAFLELRSNWKQFSLLGSSKLRSKLSQKEGFEGLRTREIDENKLEVDETVSSLVSIHKSLAVLLLIDDGPPFESTLESEVSSRQRRLCGILL